MMLMELSLFFIYNTKKPADIHLQSETLINEWKLMYDKNFLNFKSKEKQNIYIYDEIKFGFLIFGKNYWTD